AEKILVDQVGVKEIYIGPNYKFGKGRKGTPELLAEIGKELGFTVKAIPEIKSNNITFSSSKVRTLIAKGKVSEAAAYLGRNYSVEGVVIEGAKRGSTLLSTPTANISTSNELLPMDGVYAVTAELGGKIYGGAANIGCNPTFGEKKYSFEVHIFKFNKKIVGKSLKVNFIERIRDEVKFSSADELKIQMMSDITSIKNMLEKLGV
ncbi:hypothetical protein H8E50_05425, partial [bacterium]|nr:hypothetical protein [bacterium]